MFQCPELCDVSKSHPSYTGVEVHCGRHNLTFHSADAPACALLFMTIRLRRKQKSEVLSVSLAAGAGAGSAP